jgi:DNA primase
MNLFTFVKSQVSILDIIQSYTTLRKAGNYWKGHCPFHSERTGSFTVSPHKEIFYCFGCHISGDSISFITQIEHCSPLEAAKILIDRYHLQVPEDLQYQENPTEKKRYHHLCEQITQWCHEKLLKSSAAFGYLKERGLSETTIKAFKLGYFPGGLQAVKYLIHDMGRHSILIDDLIEGNILAKGKNIFYSPFEERILFPITDHVGNICGFGGRIFKSGDLRAKYYNSKESDYFNKGSLLFGLENAKKQIQVAQKVFLVEGYIDCLAMVEHGFRNTVATLGTACNAEHLKLLSRYANHLSLVYDGDKAGQQAVLRIAKLCWDQTIELTVVPLPAQEDPASLLQKGHDISLYINESHDIFLFFIQSLGVNFAQKSLSEKLSLTRTILETIQKISDPLKRDFLLQKASKTVDIPFDSLKQECLLQKTADIAVKEPKNTPQLALLADEQIPTLEKKLFCAIMQDISLFNKKKNAQYLIPFLSEPLQAILKILTTLLTTQPDIPFMQFFDLLDAGQQGLVSKLLLEEEHEIEEKEFEQLLLQLQKKYWKVIVNNIKLKIEDARRAADEQKVQELMHEFITLRKNLINV